MRCLLVLLVLAGCANTSGVFSTGPDTFTVSTSASPVKGGVPAAKRIAYDEASAHCAGMGRQLLTLSEKTASPSWTEGMSKVDLNFRCLAAGDPELQRQRVLSEPDQIIEQRLR